MINKKTVFVVIILQTFILIAAVLIGHSFGRSRSWSSTLSEDKIELISRAIEVIVNNYKDTESLSTEKLTYGAIKGITESLNDPYSQFLEPEMYKEIIDDTSGTFGGLGIEIGITKDDAQERLTVISVFEGNPAKEAGLEPGDYIMEINGESTYGISLYEAKRKLRGNPGTKVKLKIMREHEDEYLNFTITRGTIHVKTVKHRILGDNVGYMRITQFTDTTSKDVDNALEYFDKANVKGIILDLRSNPGGTLKSAVEVASSFLKKGQLIVYTKGRRKDDDKKFFSEKSKSNTQTPLIVLIDKWSASGSEIVVGAIKDYKRGIIIGDGKSTFGKGSVQTIFPLDNKSGMKLTVAHYYTPNGNNINKVGIKPDIEYPSPNPSEIRMFRSLYNSKIFNDFIAKSDDNFLERLESSQNSQEKKKFNDFKKMLEKENIILNEDLIKYALAQRTKNQDDEYKFDPVIRFALDHLKKQLNEQLTLKS